MVKNYSNEQIIHMYKEFANELGRTPTQKDVAKKCKESNYEFPGLNCIKKRFGNLTQLNKLCNFEMLSKRYTKQDLIKLLQNFNEKYGFPTAKLIDECNDMPTSDLFRIRFKGLMNAYKEANIEIPKNYLKDINRFNNLSDIELLNMFKNYYEEYGNVSMKDLCNENNMPSPNQYINRFGSLKNVYKLLNIELPKEREKYFSDFGKCTNEELLSILKKYNDTVNFPTQRKFNSKNGLPSYALYFDRFGSFQNAIHLAGINIPEENIHNFNRTSLSNEEMLRLLKYYTDEKLKNNIYLLTGDEIDKIKEMPSSGVYVKRFKSLVNAYKSIGINHNQFNNIALEKDMIKKYKQLYLELGRVPNSRDIDDASKINNCYSCSAYENHFGSIYELQIYCDFKPTIIGKNKSKRDLMNDLRELYEQLGRVPTLRDIDYCEWMSNSSLYTKKFGSIFNALRESGIDDYLKNYKIKITPKGNICRSSYEYDFCIMLECFNFEFIQEEYYYRYINSFDKKYRFDFTINYKNNIYFVEIFGITNKKWYDEKTKNKIKLCKENNLNLIDLYKEDFIKRKKQDLYDLLMNKINNINSENGIGIYNTYGIQNNINNIV